jgi:nitrate reductase NapE component
MRKKERKGKGKRGRGKKGEREREDRMTNSFVVGVQVILKVIWVGTIGFMCWMLLVYFPRFLHRKVFGLIFYHRVNFCFFSQCDCVFVFFFILTTRNSILL